MMHIKNFEEVQRLRLRWTVVTNALLAFRKGANKDDGSYVVIGVDTDRAGHSYRGGSDGLRITLTRSEARELVLRERDAVAKRLAELGVEVEAVE